MTLELEETLDELFRVFSSRLRTRQQFASFNKDSQRILGRRLGVVLMANAGLWKPVDRVFTSALDDLKVGADEAFRHHLKTCDDKQCAVEDTYQEVSAVIGLLRAAMKGEEK